MRKFVALVALLAVAVGLTGCPVTKERFVTSYEGRLNGDETEMYGLVYYQADSLISDKMPLIVFSHGSSASPGVYDGMLRRLAGQGYVVVAPQHHDEFNVLTPERLVQINLLRALQQALDGESLVRLAIELTGDGSLDFDDVINLIFFSDVGDRLRDEELLELLRRDFNYRVLEVQAAIAWAEEQNADSNSRLYGRIDTDRIIMAGHSLGGASILPFAMPDNPAYDQRVKAQILLSPASCIYDVSSVEVPTFWATGTLDMPSFQSDALTGFSQVGGKSVFVSFEDVGHITFADVGAKLFHLVNILIGDEQFSEMVDDPTLAEACEDMLGKSQAINAGISDFLGYFIGGRGDLGSFTVDNESYIAEFTIKK